MVYENILKNSEDVETYEFRSIGSSKINNGNNSLVDDYSFGDFSENNNIELKIDPRIIKEERTNSLDNGFEIDKDVMNHRGIEEQTQLEHDTKIDDEVMKRVLEIEHAAKERGYDDGKKIGREEVYNQTRAMADEKISDLSLMISEVLNNQANIFKKQKEDIYVLIKNLTKWIILRELKDDGEYLNRLLDRLIMEIDTKSNLLIQVNEKEFEKMPEVLDSVKSKLSDLSNVRLEIDYDIDSDGIVVSADNGMIDGTMEQQFKNLEKLFESINE